MSPLSGYVWKELPFKEKGRSAHRFPITVMMQIAMGQSRVGGGDGPARWVRGPTPGHSEEITIQDTHTHTPAQCN